MELDEIVPEIHVGSFPEKAVDIRLLKSEFGITAVLNLQTEDDFDANKLDWSALAETYRHEGIEVCRVPVQDFDEEDLRRHLPACVDGLDRLLREGHVVFVHCNMGMGRSPSVVVAYLHWIGGMNLDEAFGQVTRLRPSVPSMDAIRLAGSDRWKNKDA